MSGDVDVVVLGGGWGNSCLDRVSPGLAQRMLAADAAFEAQGCVVERERAERAAQGEHDRVQMSIALAEARGEWIDRRAVGRGVGRTRREAVEHAFAVQDAGNAREAAVLSRERAAVLERAELGRGAALAAALLAGHPGGFTRAEFVARAWAQADLDDARRAALGLLGGHEDDHSEVPEPPAARAVDDAQWRREVEQRRARRAEIREVAGSVVRLSQPVSDEERARAEAYRQTS